MAATEQRSAAFFYATSLPTPELAQFDDVIVEPLNTAAHDIKFLQREGSQVFAYLSLGEISDSEAKRFALPESWILGRNTAWRSGVVDQVNPKWRQWLLSKRIPTLVASGYDGLFFDTLDSFHLVADTDEKRRAQIAGLVETIRSIHKKYPKLKLYFNRGFELLPEVGDLVHALAVESLFEGWNAQRKKYQAVSGSDREWLLTKLGEVTAMNIPVTVIDYVAPAQRDKALKIAQKISALGFTPWVSVPELDQMGASLLRLIPRRVLLVYDSKQGPLALNPAHILLGNALDYLGVRVDYHDIRIGMPSQQLVGLYVGVVTWVQDSSFAHAKQFEQWLVQQIDNKIPLVFFNGLPFQNSRLLAKLGLKKQARALKKPISIQKQAAEVGYFEAPVKLKSRGIQGIANISQTNTSWLSLKDAKDSTVDPVLIAPWGGMALYPYVNTEMRPGFKRWIIEPFEFLRSALQIRNLPIVDSTTESGSRILTSHVDGDGFVSRAELPKAPYSAEVLLERIFKRYQLPHTVSVIEGETGKQGLYPKQSPDLEKIARDIFRLPNVELASHSFSHPFFWQPEKMNSDRKREYGISMPIPNYRVDLRREIIGSIDYINTRLAPPGKKVKVMLWTGDALPGHEAIALTQEAGVVNFNGGNTKVINGNPSITEVYPQIRPTPAGPQIYAPIMNENVYTNEWHGPYYGYRQVIETFKLTELPRRFKPITIYWHFYSGTKKASLQALYDIYDWALAQDHTAMYISEYAPKVEGTYTSSFALADDGAIYVKGLGSLRTLRIPDSLGYPDLRRSEGLAGFIDLSQGRYLHLSASSAKLYFQKQREKNQPYLRQANAMVEYWKASKSGASFRLKAHEPIKLEIENAKRCRIKIRNKWHTGTKKGTRQILKLGIRDTQNALLVCQ
ncbi:MAG: bifunctional glycoside hydrolase 114/ polysaccharide deacetylase family protein [Pseudomonadales bacterium]